MFRLRMKNALVLVLLATSLASGCDGPGESPQNAEASSVANRLTATEWRNDVAMGVSPWSEGPTSSIVPKGRQDRSPHPFLSPPPGLEVRVCSRIHGLAPVATTCRLFGTKALTPVATTCRPFGTNALAPVAAWEPKRWRTTASSSILSRKEASPAS